MTFCGQDLDNEMAEDWSRGDLRRSGLVKLTRTKVFFFGLRGFRVKPKTFSELIQSKS